MRAVAARVVPPRVLGTARRGAHVDIVVARHERHAIRRTEPVEPRACRAELLFECDVDQVPGDGDMVRRGGLQVVDDRRKNLAAVTRAAPQVPVHEAEQALAGKLGESRAGQGTEMGIREVGEQHQRLDYIMYVFIYRYIIGTFKMSACYEPRLLYRTSHASCPLYGRGLR